jgi:dehydrogenase/reductase SDR family member 12
MTSYTAAFESPRKPEEAFEYIANFAKAAEWDPNVATSAQREPGPVGVGTTFDLLVESSGRSIPLAYVVVTYDPPRTMVLEAQSDQFAIHDEYRVDSLRAGCRVEYEATIEMKGMLRAVEMIVARRFSSSAAATIAGLRAALA